MIAAYANKGTDRNMDTREAQQGLVMKLGVDHGGDVGIPEDETCDGGGGGTGR